MKNTGKFQIPYIQDYRQVCKSVCVCEGGGGGGGLFNGVKNIAKLGIFPLKKQ